jgi:hypothetical protein
MFSALLLCMVSLVPYPYPGSIFSGGPDPVYLYFNEQPRWRFDELPRIRFNELQRMPFNDLPRIRFNEQPRLRFNELPRVHWSRR